MKKPKFAHKSDRTAAETAEPFDTAEEACRHSFAPVWNNTGTSIPIARD